MRQMNQNRIKVNLGFFFLRHEKLLLNHAALTSLIFAENKLLAHKLLHS